MEAEGLVQRKKPEEDASPSPPAQEEKSKQLTKPKKNLGVFGILSILLRRLSFAVAIGLIVNIYQPLDPDVSIKLFRNISELPLQLPASTSAYEVSNELFDCSGLKCHAWLVLPKQTKSKPPIAVLSGGFAVQKDMGLMLYARRFAEKGIACFLIDYRGFGLSEGRPRNLVSPVNHVADIVSAANHITADPRVDGSRLAIWGTSLSGGHALQAGARLGERVKAIVSQSPSIDGRANSAYNFRNRGLESTLRLLAAGIVDFVRGKLSLSPATVPIIADKRSGSGGLAVMGISEEEVDAWMSKHPVVQDPPVPYLGGWENRTPARFILSFSQNRPILAVPHITAPILFIEPSFDSVCPVELIREAAKLSTHPRTRVAKSDYGHFELYRKGLPAAVAEMTAFLAAELGV